MPAHDFRSHAILDVSFHCDVCDEEKPVCQAVRIPFGSIGPHADLCRTCYDDGVADGIIDPATGDFLIN